jgi:hypothetical protein
MVGVTDQAITNENTTNIQFMAIHNAQSGSVSQINATTYTLELGNIECYLFSDRPNRMVETV